jgi:cellulose synthase operon protein C
MSTGPDGDDEELLLDDLEVEPESTAPPPSPGSGLKPSAAVPLVGPPPWDEVAVEDVRSDVALFESEAEVAPKAGRRAALLLEVARLRESVLGDEEAALRASRAAFAADPSLLAAFGPLRRLLATRALWEELAALHDAALAAAPLAAEDRADLLVERGRLLEDRLGRDPDAAASYGEALAAVPDHVPALLALLLHGARVADPTAIEVALLGLARRAETPARAVALAAALAQMLRAADAKGGSARALRVVREALHARTAEAPLLPLLAELDALSRTARQPALQARALGELAHHQSLPAPWVATLLREQARLLRDALGDPKGAIEALEGASRLAPGHLLVAVDLMDLAEQQDRFDVIARVVARFETAAGRDSERAQALALRQVEALGRAGHFPEALAVLDGSPGLVRAAGKAAVFGLRAALLCRARDAGGLADAFATEAARLGGAAGARALIFAAAVRQWWATDPSGAEELYRRAVAAAPTERAAWDALEALLVAQGRWTELAELLEAALSEVAGVEAAAERELTLREELVALYRDDLGEPGRALAHQKQLVALRPGDVRQLVRLRDLELLGGIDTSDAAEATAEEVETTLKLAAGADDPAVAAALKVEAARLLVQGGEDTARRDRALHLLREAMADDVTGLGTAALEALLSGPEARAAVIAAELEGASGEASAEIVRALRFRLAYHQAAAGRHAEAIAALTPLRVEGDPLARAWSWDLARRSRDAILEVAILSDEAATPRPVLGTPDDMFLALGEALERAGDAPGASAAFTRAQTLVPTADAALGLLRVAAVHPTVSPVAMREALAAMAAACADEPRVAAAARREEALLRVAAGGVEPDDLTVEPPPDATAVEVAESALVRWAAGVTTGHASVVAEALFELGAGMMGAGGAAAVDAVPLFSRAMARARLGAPDRALALHRRIWQTSHASRLAPALAELPVQPGAGWPVDRPDPRRVRAANIPGALGLTLDLEAALDAERRGALGAALGGYARVIAAAPDCLEAWEGIRRVARAGDDPLGEARALARMGALVRAPALAGALFSQAARLFEQVGRWEDAMALWGHALEMTPDDGGAFERVHALVLGDLDAPGRHAALDRLLAHRLWAAALSAEERVSLLFERALHRQERVKDTSGAVTDFKRILKIQSQHAESLWRMAQISRAQGEPAAAAPWFERFLAAAPDDARSPDGRLELAACYEATRERARAIETLRRAATLRPGDPLPMERLVDLHLRLGEWRSAVEVLRDWEGRQGDARARASLHLRIGQILRELGHDATGAAVAFRRATELDPLGAGGRALVALHDAQSDVRGAVMTIEREIGQLRSALVRDPLDEARLARLVDFLDELGRRAPSPTVVEALAAVTEVRRLLLDAAGAPAHSPTSMMAGPVRALHIHAGTGGTFWAQLAYPGAQGFSAEIWPHLVHSAVALFPPAGTGAPPRARRLNPGDEPRLAWVDASAATCGLRGLRLYLSSALTDVNPAQIIEEPEPALVLGAAALDPKPSTRFHVGRALGMLRVQAAVLERVEASGLAPLFACAALTAGAALPSEVPRPDEATLRAVGKAMSRRDRKALTLQSSRFGFESIDPARWVHAVRRTADRLGLLLAGDVGVSARAAARTDPARWRSAVRRTAERLGHILEGDGAEASATEPEAGPVSVLDEVRGSERALDVLRFALGDVYPALRREVGDGDRRSRLGPTGNRGDSNQPEDESGR